MSVTECTQCPLHTLLPEGCTPLPGRGVSQTSIMFVSDFPSKGDILQHELLSGRQGKYFDKLLIRAGLKLDEIFISSILRCRPINKNKERQPTKDEIAVCKKWVWNDIKEVNPSVIVSLGLVPTKALGSNIFKSTLKLSDVVGKHYELSYHQAVLFPCYHPKYVMTRSSKMENETVNVLSKVREFIDGPSPASGIG